MFPAFYLDLNSYGVKSIETAEQWQAYARRAEDLGGPRGRDGTVLGFVLGAHKLAEEESGAFFSYYPGGDTAETLESWGLSQGVNLRVMAKGEK